MTTTDDGQDDLHAAKLDEVSDTLEQLLDVVGQREGLDTVLDRLVHTALWVIEDADAVSVSVIDEPEPRTAAATSEAVVGIDKNQYATGEGPCLEAAVTRKPLRVSVDEARERWPAFAAAATAAGVRAYLSAPLVLGTDGEAGNGDDVLVGALNVYGFQTDAFDRLDSARLRLLTAAAVAGIGAARNYLGSQRLVDQLRTALVSRAEIDQAKGALMAVHGIDAEAAFAMLVRESQRLNLKVIVVARRLLASLARP
jgi:GAF domain-containing protein